MGEALSAESRHGSIDYLSEEPWIELEDARAHSSNPAITSSRYHGEDGRCLADDYEGRGKVLGQGTNGAVTLAIGRIDGRKYALKRFSKRTMTAESLKLLKREVQIYLSVDHPHVARLCDVYESSEELTLVMECCTGGELFDKLLEQERCSFSEPDAAAATQQMLRAVGYLHAHNIVHRDLKLENFLYESEEVDAPLKLIDFGFAKVWGPDMPPMHTCCGSIAYVSPDVLNGQGYTNKCDLWSLGVIVFMLLAGYAPFSGDSRAMRALIKAGDVDWSRRGNWCDVSANALDFVKSLLVCDPEQRPDARLASAHPWLLETQRVQSLLSTEVRLSMQHYAHVSKLHRAALQLLARELSPDETRELREVFLGLDRNHVGTISLQALTDAICEQKAGQQADGFWSYFSFWSSPLEAQQGAELPESRGGASDDFPHDVIEVFQALDANGDGEAYYSDFLAAALGSRPLLREEAVRRAFARLDADRSGGVGAADLRRALGEHFEGTEAGALLAQPGLLLDGRGELGGGAFARLLAGGRPLPGRRATHTGVTSSCRAEAAARLRTNSTADRLFMARM